SYELKWDGYRILAMKTGRRVRLMSRRHQDWTEAFRPIADEIASLPDRDVVLDGEICALDERGMPSFQLLQNRRRSARLAYFVFDVLMQDGEDLRPLRLDERRARLRAILARAQTKRVVLSETFEGDPSLVLRTACDAGLEGIVAKRNSARYAPASRAGTWLKIKCTEREEFAVVGWLPSELGESRIGSLVLALKENDDRFHFAGKVGTGYDDETRKALASLLARDRVDHATAVGVPRFGGKVRFVRPRWAAEVVFTEWTEGGHVRHPSFVGLREDKRGRVRARADRGRKKCRRRRSYLAPQARPRSHRRDQARARALLRSDRPVDASARVRSPAHAGALGRRQGDRKRRRVSAARARVGTCRAPARAHPREDEGRRVPRRRIDRSARQPRADGHPRDPHVEHDRRRHRASGSRRLRFGSRSGRLVARDRRRRAARAPRARRRGARELREDDGRKGPPRRRAARARSRLGRVPRVLARRRSSNRTGGPGALRAHDEEIGAARLHLHRLLAKRARQHFGRGLLDARAPERAGLGAARVGRDRRHRPRVVHDGRGARSHETSRPRPVATGPGHA